MDKVDTGWFSVAVAVEMEAVAVKVKAGDWLSVRGRRGVGHDTAMAESTTKRSNNIGIGSISRTRHLERYTIH